MKDDRLPRRTKRAKALRTFQMYGKYTSKHIRILETQMINQQRKMQRTPAPNTT
jgi:hypothetical protein